MSGVRSWHVCRLLLSWLTPPSPACSAISMSAQPAVEGKAVWCGMGPAVVLASASQSRYLRRVGGSDFDVDAFLAQPLTARVATSGPSLRPTWFLWEDSAFWILSGPWARLPDYLRTDPAVAIVIDICDLATGQVRQVIARGNAEILPFDVPRGRRLLVRYLGDSEEQWDAKFRAYLHGRGTVWLRVRPDALSAKDLSYSVP